MGREKETPEEIDRTQYLGGHDVAGILGLHPYLTPLQVYANKLGLSEPFGGNEATWLGSAVEFAATQYYMTTQPDEAVVQMQVDLKHPDHPFLGGHPDGIIFLPEKEKPDHMLELKLTRVKKGWGMPLTDEIPRHFLIQCMYYMGMAELPYCDVLVIHPFDAKVPYVVKFNEKLYDVIIQAAVSFWNAHVLTATPPPVSGSFPENDSAVLDRLIGQKDSDIIPATAEVDRLAHQLFELQAEKDSLKKAEESLKAQIKQAIGDHKGIEGHWGKMNWPLMDGSISYTKVVEMLQQQFQIPPELIENIKTECKGKPYRKLTPYWS